MLARNKALKIGFILASELCLMQQAMALDLGDLVLQSALAEPLDASVALQDVAGLDPSQISVSLGTADDFAAVGIELSDAASQVQFAVDVDGTVGSIHLTTAAPVEEPYLDLLLIVTWPGGMVQRDYTILMNMAGSTATVGSLVIPGATTPDSPSTAGVDFSQGDYGTGLSEDGQTYAVANGDSMWEIAARTRPGSDVSIHQMMLAIQRANADAFINNNINRVLAGKVLRIPTLQEISLLDEATAVEQVNQQNQQLSAQPLAVNRSTGNANPAPEQDELTVLTEDQAAAGAGGDGDLDATIAALESEMMLSEESLDRARLENTELTSRFKMLEEEMDLMQNLIDAEDARVAQLQANLTAQAEATEQALAATEAVTDVMAAEQLEPQPSVAGSVEGWLQNTAVLMSVVVGLLLLVLGYLFWQRRRMDAAVYAFDSGIPELETVENSTFAPMKKAGAASGWFGGLGKKHAAGDGEMEAAVDYDSAVAAGSISALPETEDDIAVDEATARESEEHPGISRQAFLAQDSGSEDISGEALHQEAGAAAFGTSTTQQDTRTITAVDDAELADELIAEAREMSRHPDPDTSNAENTAQAMKEAEELAELVAPDVEMTESTIPESFEFTLKTAPEALSEEADVETPDDIESFDFQLSETAAPEREQSTNTASPELDTSDDYSDFNALLLDEDDTGFQPTAPMNECDTKLDLAVAYEAMGDIDGAVEILDEVITDGDATQIAEARRLKGLWKNS